MIDLENASFIMPVDDVFELEDFIDGVLVTGHIERGTIKPNSTVMIVDSTGNAQISCVVNGIISQASIPTAEKKMLESASESQDDYWGIALIFHDKEVLNCDTDGIYVVIV